MNHLPISSTGRPSGFGSYVDLGGEQWYKISECGGMDEFFMCPVSSGDHWMFVSSRGALSAGRKNPDSALFPYYSSDKLVDTASCTGPLTLIAAELEDGQVDHWQPFAERPADHHDVSRHLYKNSLGNRLLFEEVNHTLQLGFRYGWTFGDRFGFVRQARLSSAGGTTRRVQVVDGIQNVLPYGIEQNFQLRYSNLGDAYKKSELLEASKIGLFYLSSIPTDRAEPSEGLRATTVWHHGIPDATVLLSCRQLARFRTGMPVTEETDVRGTRGAYFVSFAHTFESGPVASDAKNANDNPPSFSWTMVADVNQDHADVVELNHILKSDPALAETIAADVEVNERRLLSIVSSTDGRQIGSDRLRLQRHQANVLFNAMRGGLPRRGYEISVNALAQHVKHFNQPVFERHHALWSKLDAEVHLQDLVAEVAQTGDPNLCRLVLEYLPFTYSRRHGDPTRPWNAFKIDFLQQDGSEKLGYEGNWRDIFQNWEALSLSFPGYACSMIFRFVNASTADGYNPYRVTMDGFDWETVDPNDPWGNIGYWGDHQIIYLQKLLEWSKRYDPTQLDRWFDAEVCAYAQVPYRIRDYAAIRNDPQETIDFDDELAQRIDDRVARIGDDGKLLPGTDGEVCHVTLAEKLLVPALVKISNFVPDGGVWLNTQRPEWNDANNALVGRGLSVVTACYLRRHCVFMKEWFASESVPSSFAVSSEVVTLMRQIAETINSHRDRFAGSMDSVSRKSIVDELSTAGSQHRHRLYDVGLSGKKETLATSECAAFFDRCLLMIDQTLRNNRRPDGLYHSYNLLNLSETDCSVDHLYEMLEGQVAILSSGLLSAAEAIEVLDALRDSAIYREDQQSYMLYPDRQLPRFMEKNQLPREMASASRLLALLLEAGDESVVRQDVHGDLHFRGDFRNAVDLGSALDELSSDVRFAAAIEQEKADWIQLFEKTFRHQQFTGRSGTFFAYEGLGSIYWHMVSKLALAAIENCQQAIQAKEDAEVVQQLQDHYRQIRDGLGLTKTPKDYGAFPSDPYSHTPMGAGVQQPGMTGQVKEDVLSRLMELGVRIVEGQLGFDPRLFETEEFLTQPDLLEYTSLSGDVVRLPTKERCFAFTICQVPVIYHRSDRTHLTVASDDGVSDRNELALTHSETQSLFGRSGSLQRIDVYFNPQRESE